MFGAAFGNILGRVFGRRAAKMFGRVFRQVFGAASRKMFGGRLRGRLGRMLAGMLRRMMQLRLSAEGFRKCQAECSADALKNVGDSVRKMFGETVVRGSEQWLGKCRKSAWAQISGTGPKTPEPLPQR
jgi:hypothetical protein